MKTASHALSFTLIAALVAFPQLSETIYTPSLPSIVEGLMTNAHLVEWTLSIYFIGFAIGVGFWGILADKIGRRPVMLMGILLYCLATIGCWQASNISMLLLFRLVQAIGASVGSVITQTMLRDVLTGKERSRWFSLMGIPLSLAPAIGPLCGGWIDYLFNWRANFVVLLIIGLCLWAVCYFKLPETKPEHLSTSKVNLGKLLKQLCCDQKVMGSAILVAGINGILFSFYAEAPFILMQDMKLSANQYGWVGLAIGLAGLIGSVLSHRLLAIYSQEKIIGTGCGLMLIGTTGMVAVTHLGWLTSETAFIGVGLLLVMMFITMLGGMGLAVPNILSRALSDYQAVIGRAGSLFGLIYYALIALLTALMGELHNGTVYVMPWYFLCLTVVMLGVYYKTVLLPLRRLKAC